MCTMAKDLITLPSPSIVPPEIQNNPKFFPYFHDCIGAIDGTHFPLWVPEVDKAPFHNRKGFISTNVLAACSFDLKFLYVLAGWEGSAHDGLVLAEALRQNFTIPDGKYYLADAGYSQTPSFMVPYRNTRYHLKEWAKGDKKLQNARELYNLRHSSLRNAVERIFGVIKMRFPILTSPRRFSISTQVQIVIALFALT